MRGDAEKRIVGGRSFIGVEYDPDVAPPRRFADRADELWVSVVGENQIGRGRDRFRIARRDGRDPLVAIRHDCAVSPRIDKNRRKPGRQPVNPLARAGVDAFARQGRKYAIAVIVLAGGPAERARQHRPAAKPRNRDGGVCRAAAVDDEKVFRLHLGVGLWNDFDPEDLVEHEDARTQDARRCRALSGKRHQRVNTSRPRSTKARMM